MIRTDYLPRICAPGVVNDVFNNGRKAFEVGAGRRTSRPCRSSSRWPRSGSVTRWSAHATTGTRSSTTAPARSSSCSSSRRPAATSAATPGCEHLDRGLPPALRLREANKPNLAVPAGEVQPRDADRHHARRPVAAPASGVARAAGEHGLQRPAAQPRVPQPHAGEDGEARHRPADGDVPQEQGREPHEADERADPERQQRRRPERAHAGPAAGAA